MLLLVITDCNHCFSDYGKDLNPVTRATKILAWTMTTDGWSTQKLLLWISLVRIGENKVSIPVFSIYVFLSQHLSY